MIHKKKIVLVFLILLFISFEASGLNKNLTESPGDYLGQSKPGLTPEVFAPGIISTEYGDFAGTFSPDFTEFYFTRRGGSLLFNTILVSKKIGDQWTTPAVAPFSGNYADLEPHITPDGKMLLFGSNRPFEGIGAPIDFHEWYLEKTDSGWSEPILMGAPFVDRFVMYPTVTNDGTIYFTGQEGYNYYIYLSRLVEGVYQEPGKLPVEINEMGVTAHPYIAPDESYLIFDAHPSDNSRTHLFISYRKSDGSWTRLKNMGAIINDADNQAIPSVSPDGECFFFTKNADIYWMDAAIIQLLKFEPTLTIDPITGHAPLEVKFSADWSNSPLSNIALTWDFDNDGQVDSQDKNPVWTYNEPGIYTITLEVFSDTVSQKFVYEDYVHVFNGASALLFDGQNSYAQCPATPDLNLTEKLTIEAWICPNGWGEVGNFGFGRIIDKRNFVLYLVGANPGFNDNSLAVQLQHGDGSTSISTTPVSSIRLHNWQHVAVTYDGASNDVKMYIDGVTQVVTQTRQPSGLIKDNSAEELFIGNNKTGVFTFDGIIDEVRLWNVVCSAEQIQDKMNSRFIAGKTGLIGCWGMDEGFGDSISDNSDNGNDGTLAGAEWIQGISLTPTLVKNQSENSFPKEFVLNPNYPNPFNASTMISFDLMKESLVQLIVYNINGESVKTLVNGLREAGHHELLWDGMNDLEQKVCSGLYLYKLEAEKNHQAKKMLYLR